MQKTRILIVEDETAIAKMIAMNLRVANYDAVIYEDGAEAAKGLEQDHEYDLALLDVMVPGMDGFALLPIVREYGIPVIFLTAKDDLASKIQGLKGGAEDYIVKPFEVLELLVRIEKVLARTKPDQRNKVRIQTSRQIVAAIHHRQEAIVPRGSYKWISAGTHHLSVPWEIRLRLKPQGICASGLPDRIKARRY